MLAALFPQVKSCVKIIDEHMQRWEAAKDIFSNTDTKEGYNLLESPMLDSMIDKALLDNKYTPDLSTENE